MTKRLAIFASYSKTGIIEDYVLYYLKGLREIVDKIIFIADNNSSLEEINKIKDLVEYSKFERHGEYDFGSYKRGFTYARDNNFLDDIDELILCNDSCFAPIFPFSQMFSVMQDRKCDFWGITESAEIKKHLQSYFMVFKKQVFQNQYFFKFLVRVKKRFNFMTVVKSYEVPFTKYLVKNGNFLYSSYIPLLPYKKNPTFYINTLLKLKCPFIKRKVFFDKRYAKENINEFLEALGKVNPEISNMTGFEEVY